MISKPWNGLKVLLLTKNDELGTPFRALKGLLAGDDWLDVIQGDFFSLAKTLSNTSSPPRAIILDGNSLSDDDMKLVLKAVKSRERDPASIFRLIWADDATESGLARQRWMHKHGANMMTRSVQAAKQALSIATAPPGDIRCPVSTCDLGWASEETYADHVGLYHVSMRFVTPPLICPCCKKDLKNPRQLQIHTANTHGRLKDHPEDNSLVELSHFSLVVVRRPTDGKYLLVQERSTDGHWIPGGHVDPGESFENAAVRETLEEAGVKIELKGFLRLEASARPRFMRIRTIWYAEPEDINDCEPKSVPDYESMGAAWVTYEEMRSLDLRGNEPLDWAEYLEKGGMVFPRSVAGLERFAPVDPKETNTNGFNPITAPR